MTRFRWLALPLVTALAASGCADTSSSSDEDYLESVTALERNLEFESVVYVPVGSNDATIQTSINTQTRTALGSLLHSEIAVNTKELRTTSTSSWQRDEVDVYADGTHAKTRRILRVRYKYTDKAVMPKAFSRRTSFPLAVLAQPESVVNAQLRAPCTANDAHSAGYPLWYEIDTAKPACQTMIAAEQKAVRAASTKLDNPLLEVSEAELKRVFAPIKVRMRPTVQSNIKTYPEYDKLFRGGVEPGKLVIGLVNGRIDDSGVASNDSGWDDYFDQLSVVGATHTFALTAVDGSSPAALLPGANQSLTLFTSKRGDRAFRDKLLGHWLSFEAPVRVKVGGETERDFVIKIQAHFGDTAAVKRGIKTSDVFVYNGHSSLGGGLMSPSNFTAADFPRSYQILWFDSCLSFTYYEKDYFPLKKAAAGTASGMDAMELITNGLEAPSYNSGLAIGALLAGVVGGRQPSYEDLLREAIATDPLRVVDGDLDNSYKPASTPIVLKDR